MVKRRVLNDVRKFNVDLHPALLQKVARHLADAEDVALLEALHVLHGQIHHVAVVASGKTLIRRDDDVRRPLALRGVEIAVIPHLSMGQHVADGLPDLAQIHRIGLIARKTLLHLGCRDHVHRLGDLPGL